MANQPKKQDAVENLAHPLKQGIVSKRSLIILAVDLVILLLMINLLPFDPKANAGLALLVFVGILWLTEAVHVTITALCVPVLAVVLGLLTVKSSLTSFADPTIFLFFGGFALAAALHFQQVDRFIANRLLLLARGHFGAASIMLFVATALLSMWISNTATAAMMLPLTLGILSSVDREKEHGTFTYMLLGVAYAASIGGLGTMVGSPPNVIASQALGLTFLDWMKYGIPMMIIMLPLMILTLYFVFKPNMNHRVEVEHQAFEWTRGRIITLVIFGITALCWMFSAFISEFLGHLAWFAGIATKSGTIAGLDSFIAVAAAVAIGITGVAKWQQIQDNTEWGVLYLFGGGLTLTAVLKTSGAGQVLAEQVSQLLGTSPTLVVIFCVAAFIIILTEFSSNTAAAALLVPLFVAVSEGLGMPDHLLTLVIGVGASLAFMLPVATPPNAIVFGTGAVRQKDMIKAGGVLVILSIIMLTIFGGFIWGLPFFTPPAV
jgi:sodium-dependent dicarboxylate transporter 2/3/5